MMKKFYIFSAIVLISLFLKDVSAQNDNISKLLKNFRISAGIDFYYAYDNDFDKIERELSALSSFRDEMRINLARFSLAYCSDVIRGKISVHYGDIQKYNWETENPNLQEANLGFSPVDKLWIDAGYFITHIGAESFPSENYFSTFSLPSYYQPFYQSGMKVGYEFSEKFSASLFLLNGYNVIEDNNKNKSFGIQLSYSPAEPLQIVYNNIIGNENPSDEAGQTGMLNNLIFYLYPCQRLETILGLDFGFREKSAPEDFEKSAYSYGAMFSAKFKIHPKFSTAVRGEFYQDIAGIFS
ncbi:MAG: outer membrane beta-barrel protein, partial [Ignavibacteria bacterium]|nr:outer membrane beta-barrel protein [Ignavibacteria bacterium]